MFQKVIVAYWQLRFKKKLLHWRVKYQINHRKLYQKINNFHLHESEDDASEATLQVVVKDYCKDRCSNWRLKPWNAYNKPEINLKEVILLA